MVNLIIGIAIIWGCLWLLGVVLRIVGDFLSSVGQQWDRTLPGRERISYAIGHHLGILAATTLDHRLMSTRLAIALVVAALFLSGVDSAWLISSIDGICGKGMPLFGWTVFGGLTGIAMGIGSRILELGWLGPSSISRVPDIEHLREGEVAAIRHFTIHRAAAAVGAVILVAALALSYSRNIGYDAKADFDKNAVVISSAAMDGRVTILNAALDDAAGLLQSDPKLGLKTLLVLKAISKVGVRPEVDRVAKVAQKYLDVFRDETEILVNEGKPEALARSEAFLGVDRMASVKWLGRLYESGTGGANRDLSKAFAFYVQAANMGDKAATKMLDKVAHLMISAKEESARKESFKYLELKAQSGRANDHYWLAQWYAASQKPEDQKNAEKWLAKALSQDDDAAIKNLAFSALARLKNAGPTATKILDDQAPKFAKGMDENMKTAAYAYLEQRANTEDPGAMLWMGFRYAEGDGIPKDEKQAHDWFLKAALQDKNQIVKNKAFEALGEKNHPPIQGTEFAPLSPSTGISPSSAVVSEKPESEPKVTSRQPMIPAAPTPAPVVRERDSSIPLNARWDNTGRSWTCNQGYRQSGSECAPVQVPPNARLDYSGHDWTCSHGYRQRGNECLVVQIPPNARLDYSGHDWTCSQGYRQRGNECLAVQIPPYARLDYSGHDWTCKQGYRQRGNECLAVQIPQNARLDYSGHDWTCNQGYRQRRNECEAVLVPANGQLDYTGHSWTCKQGFRQAGTECLR